MTTDDFDLNDIDSSPEESSESSESASPPNEPSLDEPIIEIDVEGATHDDEDGWDGPNPEDAEDAKEEPHDEEALGEIIDPRLATVEGGSSVDTSIPDPRLITETPREPTPIFVGPTVEQLQAKLAAALEAQDYAYGSYQSAIMKLQAAEEAGSRVGVSLADEMRLRAEAEAALRETQGALLTESMKASNLSSELDTTRIELARVEREFTALSKRHIFQIIPAYKEGQARDTRIYVLADDAIDAIRRVERAGVLPGADVDNITKTSQKLVV